MSDNDDGSGLVIIIITMMVLSGVVFLFYYAHLIKPASTSTVQLLSIDSEDEDDCDFTLGIMSQVYRSTECRYYVASTIYEDGSIELFKMPIAITTFNATLGEGAYAYADVDTNWKGDILAIRLYVPKNYKYKVV